MRRRSLRQLLFGWPRLWVLLFAWTGVVLLLLVLRHLALHGEARALDASEAALVVSALVALALLGLITAHTYLAIRDIRNRLFEGNYEEAYKSARRHEGALLGLDLDTPLRRLLDFDLRRAERVAAANRLVGRLLRETPLLLLFGDLAEGQLRFSDALCRLFDIHDSRFPLDSVLMYLANRDFTRLWRAVANGEKESVEGEVILHLPVRQAARRLRVRLLPVQDEEGAISYVIGFASLPEADAAPQAESRESILA